MAHLDWTGTRPWTSGAAWAAADPIDPNEASMANVASRISVTSTAVRLDVATETDVPDSNAPAFASRYGQRVIVRNRDASLSVFIGGATVSATAYELLPGDATPILTLYPGDALYGITASGTAVVHVLQLGV